MFQPDWNAALADYDKREAEITRSLPYLEQTLPLSEYRRIAGKFAKELIQMNVRRRLISAFLANEENT